MRFILVIICLIYISAEIEFHVKKSFESNLRAKAHFQVVPSEKNMFAKMTPKQVKAHLGLRASPHDPEALENGDKILHMMKALNHNPNRLLSECSCSCNCSCPDNPQPPPGPEPTPTEDNYDIRDKFPQCIGPVRDQGNFGSCWAHSAVNVFSSSLCIQKQKDQFLQLSIQDLVSCDQHDGGCNGGQLDLPFKYYMTETGITTDSCIPYESGNGNAPVCPTQCKDPQEEMIRYKCLKDSFVDLGEDAEKKKSWLKTQGPLNVGFEVFEDFLYYKSGIYAHVEGASVGGHAVILVGYGRLEGVDYWILKNSWSSNWGEDGYFKMKMGECSLDTWGATSCLPE